MPPQSQRSAVYDRYFDRLRELVDNIIGLGNKMGEGWLLTAEMMELVEHGYNTIICAQPFACLPNHVVGKVVIKEIRFGPQTDEHDYNFKLKHAQEFLKDGNKVKAYVFFRGRSILFKEQGELLLARFANDLEEFGKVEAMPKLEGKRMIVNIAPKK